MRRRADGRYAPIARAVAIDFVLVLAGLVGSGPALALDTTARTGPVEVRVTLTPDAPRIGDPLKLSIEAVAEPGVEVLMPAFGEALDRFAVTDFVPRERIDDSGRTIAEQHYTLKAPSSGEHDVPSILVEFVDRRPGREPAPEGQDAYELLTEPIPFVIESVVPESAEADLSPPLGRLEARRPDTLRVAIWIAATLLALLAAAAPFAWRLLGRLRTRASERSAYEIARTELDVLLGMPRADPEQIDAFFVSLSGLVRRYLERRFGLRSPELTTERFLEVVSGSPDLTDAHRDLLRDFLRECDLVKFAHVIPSETAIRQAVTAATRFIEDTGRPRTDGVAPVAEQGAAA